MTTKAEKLAAAAKLKAEGEAGQDGKGPVATVSTEQQEVAQAQDEGKISSGVDISQLSAAQIDALIKEAKGQKRSVTKSEAVAAYTESARAGLLKIATEIQEASGKFVKRIDLRLSLNTETNEYEISKAQVKLSRTSTPQSESAETAPETGESSEETPPEDAPVEDAPATESETPEQEVATE